MNFMLIQERHHSALGRQPKERPLTATVSGSFRRYMDAVQDAVYALTDLEVTVLSPADPRVVDQFGDFLFVVAPALLQDQLPQARSRPISERRRSPKPPPKGLFPVRTWTGPPHRTCRSRA